MSQFLLADVSWHSLYLADLARQLKPESYLEVGIYEGETFKLVSPHANRSFGIDISSSAIRSIANVRHSTAFLGTLGDFIGANHGIGGFDLIFIDADHAKDSVISDFDNACNLLAPNGLLVLHDTWPGSIDFAQNGFCGDAYLAVPLLREKYSDWSFVTLPTHPGMTFCQRNSARPDWAA